jgi:hypothetical protein
MTEVAMTRLAWIVLAALAAIAGGCSNNDPLYTNPKYTHGYMPSGSTSVALVNDRGEWRSR